MQPGTFLPSVVFGQLAIDHYGIADIVLLCPMISRGIQGDQDVLPAIYHRQTGQAKACCGSIACVATSNPDLFPEELRAIQFAQQGAGQGYPLRMLGRGGAGIMRGCKDRSKGLILQCSL